MELEHLSDRNSAVTSILAELLEDSQYAKQVAAHAVIPARVARYGPWPEGLDECIIAMLAREGFNALYSHQAQAVETALRGENVAVVTPTASGKSLCYDLPIYQALLHEPGAAALFLFPTKALAHDQLDTLNREMGMLGLSNQVDAYDGDTPTSRRTAIRENCRVIVSNPDMLHASILPSHPRWQRFFSGLCYVVIDEMHQYRGVFGSHVANVIRRLKRLAAFYGSNPQFLLASATIANPQELAETLVGQRVTVISENGAPSGEKHLIFYNPPVIDAALGIRRSYTFDVASIAQRALVAGVQSIVFTRSRLVTELLLRVLRENAPIGTRADGVIAGYRGGYLPVERRAIEKGLREGAIRAVVGTNALELGVDIGGLDVAIMSGYPGSIASTWQQAGRAGRGQAPSVAVLVASPDPLDQYIVRHPEYVTGSSPERALIDPNNVYLLLQHLKCALFELPLEQDDAPNGSAVRQVLDYLVEEGWASRRNGRWHWAGTGHPPSDISLRTSQPDIATVVAQDETGKSVTIGQCDWASVPRLLHEGAIYMHSGQQYLVEHLDWEQGLAETRLVEMDYYTRASSNTKLLVQEVWTETPYTGMLLGYGQVSVTSQVTGYRRIRLDTNETLGWGEIDLPPQTMMTTATWCELSAELIQQLVLQGVDQVITLGSRGPNWPTQREAARQRDGFCCVRCGAPEQPERPHHVHHLVPFREFHWVPGHNQNYARANDLDNLITLCPDCHREAEKVVVARSALAGLGRVLNNLVPLFAMCDRNDVGILTEGAVLGATRPRLYIYDEIPAGVGLAERVMQVFVELMDAAAELVANCGCEAGCPSCVGPVETSGAETKRQVVLLAQALGRAMRVEFEKEN